MPLTSILQSSTWMLEDRSGVSYLADGTNSVRHVREGNVVRDGKHAGQAHVLLNNVPEDGQHRDATMLDLHVPKALKPVLVSVLEPVEGVPEAEWRLYTELVFKRHLHGG